MKNKFPVSLFILIVFFSTKIFAQEKTEHFSTKKTSGHVAIPGFPLFIELPDGFSPAPHFPGWQNNNGSQIILSKKQKSIDETLADVKNRLAVEGSSSTNEKLVINNNPSVFIYTKQKSNSTSENDMLIIEKDGMSYLIDLRTSGGKAEMEILRKSVLTVYPE